MHQQSICGGTIGTIGMIGALEKGDFFPDIASFLLRRISSI
jgi:hypothetical protein